MQQSWKVQAELSSAGWQIVNDPLNFEFVRQLDRQI